MLNCFASKASAMINGDIGFSMHSGGKLNLGLLSKGNFSKKQQARAMEHVSVKPNERRKKLSLLQIQRGEVIKCRQIWQGSQKCKGVLFVLIFFSSVLILFPFARCHVSWCMQTCNVYMDSTIIFYFLFYRDSSITWQTIFNQGDAAYGRCRGIAGVGRRTN